MSEENATPSATVRVVAALVVLLVAGAAAELGLRVYHKAHYGTPITTLFPQYRDTRHPLSPFLVFGPRVDYQIQDRAYPELAYFDERGLRTNEPVWPKPVGEYRILALGGSTTENVWNDLGLHWPLALECWLRAAGYEQVRVLNGAMSAYTTAHTLVRLEFGLLDLEPDLVIVMHGVNDWGVSLHAAQAGEPLDGHYAVQFLEQQFLNELREEDAVLLRLPKAIVGLFDGDPAPEPLPPYDLVEGERLFERNLGSIAAVSRARGADVVFLTMPFDADRVEEHRATPGGPGITRLPPRDRFEEDMQRFNRSVLDVADTSVGVTGIDMAARIAGEDSLFVDVVHYSSAGVERFGALLGDALVGQLPVEPRSVDLSAAARRRCSW